MKVSKYKYIFTNTYLPALKHENNSLFLYE